MVRSQFNRPHPPVHDSHDPKDRYPPNRQQRNRSPGYGQTNYRRSPRPKRRSPLRVSSDPKGGDKGIARAPYRRENLRSNDLHSRNRDASRSLPNNSVNSNHHNNNNNNNSNNREMNKRPKWRRNRNKKKRRGGGGGGGGGKGRVPPLSGGNRAPVVAGNRQPIASMRMRMDDYVTPRMGRLLPLNKTNDIERAVARARREASTRTKDTFWTKKLLDAETSHPNRSFRWAHSGFKELYREELGYSELEYKEEKKLLDRSPPRGSRDDYDRRTGVKRARSPSNKQGSSREKLSSSQKTSFASKDKVEIRKKVAKSPRKFSRSRSRSKSRSVSRSRSPRNRKHSALHKGSSKLAKPTSVNRKSSYLRPNKRSYSHSLSCSPSTISSRSRSHSHSRSYSSYSRSSSVSSTSSSSSFSSSTSGSYRKRRRRSYSRSSKSWSRSPSVPRPPPKIKTASLSKAVQSVHAKKEKKKLTKTVSNSAQPKHFYPNATNISMKQKTKLPRPGVEAPPKPRRNIPITPPVTAPLPPSVSSEFYEKELASNKSPVFVEAVEKVPLKADVRRGPESQNFKAAILNRELNATQTTSARSEGEQSNTDSSTDDDDAPLKMTLSERFGKLAQLSSQRQEYEGVRMKIVREGGQDKKVYLEGDSRSPSPLGRRSNGAHERWLREHKAEYDEYEERYGEFRQWDPHRDLPRELPPNWDDVNVRYRYYKESGYFGERSITMEDYLKWEEWWYRYRDWLEKYGGSQEDNLKYRGPYNYESVRSSTRDRWMRREKEDRKRHRY